MKTAKLITRIEEVNPVNQIQVGDLINELENLIFLKNRMTEKTFELGYVGTDQYFKDCGTIAHYKLKTIALITTL
jgi:hypothetical protein